MLADMYNRSTLVCFVVDYVIVVTITSLMGTLDVSAADGT